MLGARSFVRSVGLSVCVLALSACEAFDSGKLQALLMPIESPDAGDPPDSGTDGPCMPRPELCNGKDDDCDDKVDEQADEACMQPMANSVCASGGRCVVVSCADGYLNCNGDSYDGCEHDATDGPCPMVCTMCEDAGSDAGDAGDDAGPKDDGAVEPVPDAEVDASDTCTEMDEVCDGEDNDCDDAVDETPECAIQRCAATTPSYRGEACDRCVCEKCNSQRLNCQANQDETWRKLCTDVVECYVVENQAGNCGDNQDCYATGACSGAIHLAAGGVDANDNIPAATGGCAATNPPTTACQAVTNYRNECTLGLCATECAQ
jgi:hypothetical protein